TVIADPFPGNRIPAARMNPTSVAIEKLVPLPNFGAAGAQSRNFFRQTPRSFDGDQWDLRIDQTLGRSNNFFARFSLANQSLPSPGVFDGFIGGGSSNIENARHLVLSDTHIFSPNVVNELRFGYVRHNGSILGDAPSGVDFSEKNQLALF